jgi:Flp pilus assembly protein TadG
MRTTDTGRRRSWRPRRPSRRLFRRPFRGPSGDGERGSMAVELVIMTPVLVMFMLLVVAFGRYVWIRGQIEAAARDAVRAAAFERSAGDAEAAADDMAQAQLEGRSCSEGALSGAFVAGGTIKYTLTCHVSYDELGLIGLPDGDDVTVSSDAPLDQFRRTG